MTIFWNNIKRIFLRKTNIICMVVVPIVVNIIVVSLMTSNSSYTVGITDNDQTKFTEQFVETLSEKYDVVELDEDEVSSKVINSKVDLALVFDEGYTAKLIAGEDAAVKSYMLTDGNNAQPLKMNLNSYLSAIKEIAGAAGSDEEAFYQGIEDYSNSDYQVEYKNLASSVSDDIERSVTSLGYLALGMMFLMSFSTMLILEDKMVGVFDRLTVTPLRKSSYYVQNLLSFFVVSCIQIVVIVNVLPNIVDISYGDTTQRVMEIILVSAVFAMVCIAIGILISRFAKSTLFAGSFVSLVNIPLLMLGGCLWPREIMPETVQKIGDFMPTTWYMQAAESVLYGDGLGAVRNEILYMLAVVVVLLTIAFVAKTDKETL
ncbi:ABC transporter permease [Anaeromicropila populeti]|uniref:ABC-2 type transport system permease protein n=1 Tax=Anaeromicropila populeti TaxID=37658 RepID=A0A1I6IT81_9FIRM|nr:ABC transporter permease [Anaeromicropila populeti]SFR69933.1 ABC-2 type transport system permease protein [Anaeromicropila populeti]